jgi:hypothetical protein
MNKQSLIRIFLVIWFLLTIKIVAFADNQSLAISIITDQSIGSPVEHGLFVLTSSLDKQKITWEKVGSIENARGKTLLVVGLFSGNGTAAKLVRDSNQPILSGAESLYIWNMAYHKKPVWVINGSDDRGIMYGLLDVAERIDWITDPTDPFSKVIPMTETPEVSTRAISIYTMNRAYWESRFYDEDYWATYMDMLAKNRFNSLVVIFGYENGGFLAPCYPYFFDVDGFPGVKMGNITAAEQEKNLTALNRMIEMAHERGITFKVGIWDHIYRGGVQTGGLSQEELSTYDTNHLVKGLDSENLLDYTNAALIKFMQKVPNLDGIQFRMHNESGLRTGEEMERFWTGIFNMLKTTRPEFQIDLRAKELPEMIIQIAKNLGLNFTITTKYWMEQMGLPFHPTHINREDQFNRRHGYADMLSYPQEYKIHWRLWTGGTQRILLWGSPKYVRRFIASTHLYNGTGFEVNEPLATKMEAQPHNIKPFALLNPPYVYYQYEFERYWHFFQVFGRLGYNLNTPSEVWDREFEKRFGKDSGDAIEEALHKASWVLPMIVAACSPYSKFPTTRGWPEKQRYGDLPEYARAEGSDIQQFASFDTEAKLLIEGGETAQRLPSATSNWFAQTSQEINALIAKAETLAPADNKEFHSTITDLKILSDLAFYHSLRIPAAICYRIYKRTNDPHALDDAIGYEKLAIEAWQKIVEAAGEIYASDLKFGVHEGPHLGVSHHLSGHWSDELGYLKNGLMKLESERSTFGKVDSPRTAPIYKAASTGNPEKLFQIQHEAIRNAPANHSISIKARIKASAGIKWVRLRYRSVNQHLDYQTLPMEAEEGSDVYFVDVPASQIDPKFDFMYFIEVMDNNNHGVIYPDLGKETPYIVIALQRE